MHADAVTALVWACLAAAAYGYVGYPVVLLAAVGLRRWTGGDALGRVRAESEPVPEDWPVVAVVISAYNEERHVAQRLDNLLRLDYPSDRLRIYIGSDGSTDGTARLIRRCPDPRVHAEAFERNRGKASVLNDLVARGREPIVVFSDANTMFDADAIKRLVRHFDDPKVGAVSGELSLSGGRGGDNQDGVYWRIEQQLKRAESRIGGLLGANGAIYAIRRSLWRPLRPDTICDDFCTVMNVAAAGYRVVYEPAARAHEEMPDRIVDEFKRRLRIGIGNFQALFRHPEYLVSTSWATRFCYVSHKVLRWVTPHLLIVALMGSAWLAWHSAVWRWFTGAQVLAYAGAAAFYALSVRGARLPRALGMPAFLFALNWAFLIASWRYARGQYGGAWRRTAR